MAAGSSETTKNTNPGGVREGLAEILPVLGVKGQVESNGKKDGNRAEVFYNPAQVFNRDLSVLVLKVFAEIRSVEKQEEWQRKVAKCKAAEKPEPPSPSPGLRVLEALAATGIRSIRYAKELGPGTRPAEECIREIVANDLEPSAVEHMRRNLTHNSVPGVVVSTTCEDANCHMYGRRSKGPGGDPANSYDVIDIDPYGSCSIFLDAAVQSVRDGGLLCITSTDMPVLGGNNPETCFCRYGGINLKAGYLHEMALRLVLHAVTTSAAKYGRDVQPLISCSIDFYVRVFVRVFDSPGKVKQLVTKTAVIHQCSQCDAFTVQPIGECTGPEDKNNKFKPARVVVPGDTCNECKGRTKMAGPCYSGPLFDPDFVDRCLSACETDARKSLVGVTSWKKINGMLLAISEEYPDICLFYRLPNLCKSLKLRPMPMKRFRGTLKALGYRAGHFHRDPEAVKTDAPNEVVYDLLRLWAEENPRDNYPLPEILKKEFTIKRPVEWVTDNADEEVAEVDGRRPKKIAKFLPNPEAHWGPKRAAKMGGTSENTAP